MNKKAKVGVDFKEDVKINRYCLEEECEIQPEMYYYYAEQLAGKKALRDMARAKLELDIREFPDKYIPAGAKLTEGYVDAVIRADEALAILAKEILLLDAAVSALEDRRSQLKNLTELFMAGYFSTVDAPQRRSSTDIAEDEIRGSLTRKKNRRQDNA